MIAVLLMILFGVGIVASTIWHLKGKDTGIISLVVMAGMIAGFILSIMAVCGGIVPPIHEMVG